MIDPRTFSFSRVTTFEQCPRRYRYRYLDQVREGFQSIEAFMGQQVHATLEWMFEQRESGRLPSAEQSVAYYCSNWDAAEAASPAPVRVVKNGNKESYRRLGAEILADFHRARFVSDPLRTLATEKHFAIELDGGIRFQGFIDRLACDDGGLIHIIDFKTGKRVPMRFEGKDAEQLEAYAVATFMETDADELVLVLEYLRTGRSNSRVITRDEAPQIARRLVARIEAPLGSTVFPPSPGILCDWCGFNDLCEAAGDRWRKEN